jgi:hypothetical protein
MLEGMRDLHPTGGFSKVRYIWKYDGPHGSGNVQLFRRVGEIWEPQEFVAPDTAWVYYLDELQPEATMTADTCVIQLYRSLWTFILGACLFHGHGDAGCVGEFSFWTHQTRGNMSNRPTYYGGVVAVGSRPHHV